MHSFAYVEEVLSEGIVGDLVEIHTPLGYTHWAVYVGEGWAIHVDRPDKNKADATVKKEKLVKICGTSPCRINNLEDNARRKRLRPRSPHNIKAVAESLIGLTLCFRIFSNNCEFFVTSCRYGFPFSEQVEILISVLIYVGTAITKLGAFFMFLGFLLQILMMLGRVNRTYQTSETIEEPQFSIGCT